MPDSEYLELLEEALEQAIKSYRILHVPKYEKLWYPDSIAHLVPKYIDILMTLRAEYND